MYSPCKTHLILDHILPMTLGEVLGFNIVSFMCVSCYSKIDTGELCSYFSQHLGDFKEIFGTCEDLNKSMTKVLYSTAEVSCQQYHWLPTTEVE